MTRDWLSFIRRQMPRLGVAREDEIRAELAQQLEQVYQEALAAGAPEADARRRAEAHIPDWVEMARAIAAAETPVAARLPPRLRLAVVGADAMGDLRYALRGLRRAPGFALVAVLTLAFGIGANTAIFSWVHAELLQALPFDQAGRLVVLNESDNGRTVSDTYPDFVDWRAMNESAGARAFADLSWYQTLNLNVSGAAQPELVNAADVSSNFFSTLGVRPRLGRAFTPAGDTAAAAPEAVISHTLWQRQFGGSASALGRTLDLDQRSYTVIGVLPPGFEDYNQTEVFLPAGLFLKSLEDRGAHDDADTIARLAPGATLGDAQRQQQDAVRRLALAYPATNAGEDAVVRPIRALFVGNDAPMLWLLLAAVGLVLLIACANVANLTLVRTAARQQEWEIRAALGAGRGRLIRQLLAESLTLAALGGVAGVAVAAVVRAGLQRLTSVATLHLNLPVLAFMAALCGIAALLFGLIPARHAGRMGNVHGGGATTHPQARHALVVCEVALALMLAAAAGLTLRSFARLMAVNPGFHPQQVLTFGTNLAGPRYQSPSARIALDERVLAGLAALPGTEAAGLGTNLPLTGNHSRSNVTIAGRPLPAPGHFPHPDVHVISPGYLAALGLPLLRGRNFTDADGATSPEVALVSASFARAYWPGTDAVGQQFWSGSHPGPDNHDLVTIVGVVGDTKQYGLDAATRIEIYLPFAQAPPMTPQFLLRTALPPLQLAADASAALRTADAALPAVDVQTLDHIVATSVANPRATLSLLIVFGGLALALATIGIYGVVSYSTQQRTHEIGIRIALGAEPGAIAGLVLRASLRSVAIGIAFGLVGSLAVGRLLAAQLFGASPVDPAVLAAAVALLFAVGVLATALPARRATRVDPLTALRYE